MQPYEVTIPYFSLPKRRLAGFDFLFYHNNLQIIRSPYYYCRIIGQNTDIQSIIPSVWNQYMNKHEDPLDIFHRSLQIVRIY